MTVGADIAVTGVGLVTPAGTCTADSWEAVRAGRPTAAVDPALAGNPVRLSSRVPGFCADTLLGARRALRLDRFVQFALVAAQEAVADAGLDPASWDGARVGVVMGSADGGPGTVEEQHRVLLTEQARRVSPLLLPMQLPNMLAGQLAITLGATGPNLVVATACASGATAVGTARDLLALDRCDIVVAGGSEAMITPLVMAGFAQMGALSGREDDPDGASRPFDVDRDGFVAAEGAGVLVLERGADAR
ncbi:beta-ketoacyl-[acyl-carrier-protein] synthase family protein, partial [Streptomyces sp. S6]